MPDLPGYGWSGRAGSPTPTHAPYTKRAMANAMIEVMEALGHVRFRLAGHDRGGRVAYRLALDHPGRLDKLATLDIVPTWAMWHRMDARLANRAWHWMFLALPAPFPETHDRQGSALLLRFARGGRNQDQEPRRRSIRARSRTTTRSSTIPCASTPPARTIAPAAPPISPTTRRSRAAAKKITCPMLAIWGGAGGIPAETDDPLATWREWATDVRGFAIDSGHYLAEEAPEATAEALIEFFARPEVRHRIPCIVRERGSVPSFATVASSTRFPLA